MSIHKEIVGLIPAGGYATRLSPLPCSKELFPIGWWQDRVGEKKPKVVSHFLLDKYKAAGIRKTYIILRKGKWDIPEYYGDGAGVDMDLAYLIMNLPHGHPFTLDQAFPFTKDNLVAFGYPDVLLGPDDAFSHLVRKQVETKASVVLGIFPIRPAQRWKDILAFGKDGKIETIALKDRSLATQLWGWAIALWNAEFSLFMHEFLFEKVNQNSLVTPDGREYTMNNILQAALDSGIPMEYVIFNSGFVHDVGTPEDLLAAQREQLVPGSDLKN